MSEEPPKVEEDTPTIRELAIMRGLDPDLCEEVYELCLKKMREVMCIRD